MAVQKSHEVLDQVLEICLLLLREPGAQQLTATTRHVPELFSTIIRARMDAVTLGVYDGFASETELFEILLDSLIPIIIEYEREGNAQRQTAFGWSNPSGVIARVWCRDRPTLWELSWMDRLAEARDELWQDIRARNNPDILTLGPGWPRGLPIQKLVTSEEWIYHALEHPTEMPYLASRANEVLFSPVDTVMTLAPEKLSPVDGYVDYLGFAVEALIEHRTKGDRSQRVLRVWEHYSSALQPHPLYLELFQDWLASLSKGKVPDETVRLIRPAPTVSRPSIWSFSRGPEVTEWDPQGAVEEDVEIASGGDEEKPQRVPRTILNCRMCGRVEQSDTVPTRQDEPRKTPEYCSVWSLDCQFWREVPRVPLAVSRDSSVYIRELFMISALLFLDTFTKDPRILRERFPNVEHPRYTPTHLADEFLAREIKLGGTQGALQRAVTALEVCKKRVPAQLLRNIVCSFLDTLKAAPDASMYPILLTTTIKSFKILLETDQPHLAVDIALRVWQEFSDESSRHRALNLVTIGRTLLPHQASDMMRRFAEYVCSALQKQQQQQMEKAADKPLIKVTTAKMLAQALADADFLPQSTRMHLLQRMYDVSNHIDIRKEIFTSLLQLVSHGASAEPYRVFASIALSAAGPSERDSVTEADWDKAENGGALPPVVLESSSSSFSYYGIGDQRPILNLVVIDALSKIPETLRSDYVHKVLLPLVQESTRQHARWMTCLVTRLGLSLPDLGLTESDIGPFPPELVKTVLREWREFLPKTYLQIHRSWALSYLHHQSFTRISEALANTQDPNLRTPNVQDHWKEFLKSQRDKFLFYGISPRVYHPEETIPRELTDELMLEEYILRAEIVIKNPVRYRPQSSKYTLHAGYALDILRSLRRTRDAIYTADPARRQRLYAQLTRAMDRVAHVVESVRKEGTTTQSSTLDTYPVTLTLPTAFECEVLLLPSLEYDTAGVRAFVSRVIALIAKYADDPVLLLKLDAFDEVLRTVASNRQCLMTCALGLGRVCPSVEGQRGLVETCARVKLARRLLGYKQTGDGPGDKDVVDMVEEWKRSDVEIVRGIGWEWEWTDAQDRMKGGSVRANPQTR